MAKERNRHPLYVCFLCLMVLLLIGGLALLVYGSAHNGMIAPRLPGMGPLADTTAHLHG